MGHELVKEGFPVKRRGEESREGEGSASQGRVCEGIAVGSEPLMHETTSLPPPQLSRASDPSP